MHCEFCSWSVVASTDAGSVESLGFLWLASFSWSVVASTDAGSVESLGISLVGVVLACRFVDSV